MCVGGGGGGGRGERGGERANLSVKNSGNTNNMTKGKTTSGVGRDALGRNVSLPPKRLDSNFWQLVRLRDGPFWA